MKENELKVLKKEMEEVLEEKESLKKIKSEQDKALDFLKNEEEYSTKVINIITFKIIIK